MSELKLLTIVLFAAFGFAACFGTKSRRYVIAESKAYDASLFRQHCAICHGPEADGKLLDNSLKVPSLRQGEFKAPNPAAIQNQIANGGNGMPPFRDQLTQREMQMMTDLVYRDLRGN
jgi:mono/diheme cytochrome c family protein